MSERDFGGKRDFDPTEPPMDAEERVTWMVCLKNPVAKLPERKEENAGWDLFCVGDWILNPGDTVKVPTGICGAIPPNHVGIIYDKSSMGAAGVPKYAGVIDHSYRGEILIVLHNSSKEMKTFNHGDKIAQLIIHYVPPTTIREVPFEMLPTSERGTGGFGSTGGSAVIDKEKERHQAQVAKAYGNAVATQQAQGGKPALEQDQGSGQDQRSDQGTKEEENWKH